MRQKNAEPALPEKCPRCGGDILSVAYYDAKGAPLGGHRVCTNCGSRSASELPIPSDVRRGLLERKAS